MSNMPRTAYLAGVLAAACLGCSDSEGDDASSSASGAAGAGASASSSGAGASGGTGAAGGAGSGASGPGGSGGGAPGCSFTETPGESTQTIDVGGTERSYVLAIPESVDGKTPVPVIFGFHGFGGTGEGASNYFGLTGTEGALYVYPQALPLPDQGGGIGWDMEVDGVDVAFFDALLAELAANHCVDLGRVFSAGHSHGASFSNHLGCYRAEVLRAIAPVAGGGPWAGRCMGSVSAMLTHGADDGDVPIQSGIDSRDHWLEANACAGAQTAPTDPSPCVAYDGCAEPVLWCEHGGGHEWPEFAGAGIRGFFLSF
jgi:poly(3-hydroxybutyrate) depolymerase